MELGEKLRLARLEAGLSQRQLCGDRISRNMLSLIEHGSARPSMDTLRFLAQRLGKPVGFFLEEAVAAPENVEAMAHGRQRYAAGDPAGTLEALKGYHSPDPLFDQEAALLTFLACTDLAQQVLVQGKTAYAQSLLAQASEAAKNTVYFTEDLDRRLQLLRFQADPGCAATAEAALPPMAQELLLRARAALDRGDFPRCLQLLSIMPDTPEVSFLRGEATLAMGDCAAAAEHFHACEDAMPRQCYPKLEECYRTLKNYEKAYFYACKQRELL